MTKRTATTISGLALAIMFAFSLSARAAGFERPDRAGRDYRANVNSETLRPNVRFDSTRARSADQAARVSNKAADRADRDFVSTFEYRAASREKTRSFFRADTRFRTNEADDQFNDRPDGRAKSCEDADRTDDRFGSGLDLSADFRERSNSFFA